MTLRPHSAITRRGFCLLTGGLIAVTTQDGLVADENAAGLLKIQPPVREKPKPGSVQLNNGLILSGLCSRQSTLAPDGTDIDQRFELRMIDQGARRLYVSNRRSAAAVVNPLDWSAITFEIKRKRLSRDPLPRGQRAIGPFDANGIARGEVLQADGRREPIQVAITRINELSAEVVSLTHDLEYAVAFDAIPRQHLFPGLLQQVEGYNTEPFRRLELVRMLIKADRLPEAGLLLQTLATDFPEHKAEQDEYQQSVREALARQITGVLEHRRDVGQHQLASNGARLHPHDNLTPETIVRVTQLVQDYDDRAARMAQVRAMLRSLLAELPDDQQRAATAELVSGIDAQLDDDSIDRLSAFELIARADGNGNRPAADEQLAMAGSGWLLGAEGSLRSLPETLGLFQVRQSITDYLNTDATEAAIRTELLERIVTQEGVSIERVAALIRQMPAPQPLATEPATDGNSALFRIAATPEMAGAVGLVPPEYHPTRNYPLIIGFNGNYGDPENYLSWWQTEAARHGCIVVVPIWHQETNPEIAQTSAETEPGSPPTGYDASAAQHRQFLNLLRRVKLGLRIDDDRVFVAGHGFGGETAMDLATSHPDLFAGVISICGLGRKHLQWTAWNAMNLPWYVVVGDDQPGWYERMGLLSAKLYRMSTEHKLFPDVLFVKYPNRGAENYIEEADDVLRWMLLHTRQRDPELISADLIRSTDLDWYWLRVTALPEQFAQLDAPSTPLDEGFRTTELRARRNNRNDIIIESAPGDVTLFLSPEMPGYDAAQPMTVVNGRTRLTVKYQPEIAHLLERLYETADRSRLCFMRVTVPERTAPR